MSGPTGPITVNLADDAVVPNVNTTITGYGGTITLVGVETANLIGTGQALNVVGTSQDDQITYRPTGPAAGRFVRAGLNTVFNFSVISTIVNDVLQDPITFDGGVGFDTIVLEGTSSNDAVDVFQDAPTNVVTDNYTLQRVIGGTKAILAITKTFPVRRQMI